MGAQFSGPWANAFLSIILTSVLLSARRNKKMSKRLQGAEPEAKSLSVHQGITGHVPFVPAVPSDGADLLEVMLSKTPSLICLV